MDLIIAEKEIFRLRYVLSKCVYSILIIKVNFEQHLFRLHVLVLQIECRQKRATPLVQFQMKNKEKKQKNASSNGLKHDQTKWQLRTSNLNTVMYGGNNNKTPTYSFQKMLILRLQDYI